MILDNIKKTIGGDEFISLPVALGLEPTKIICTLDDTELLTKQDLDYIEFYMKFSNVKKEEFTIELTQQEGIIKLNNKMHYSFAR